MLKKLLGCAAIAVGLFVTPAQADQFEDIMKAKKIRISTDVAIPPAGMMDAQMQRTGSDVETAQLLAKDWGLELEFIPTTGATRIPNLLTDKADIVISTLSVTPDRAKVIDFSKPYTFLQSVVGGAKEIDVKGLDAMRGMTVAVTRGTTQDTKMSALAAEKGITINRYDDDATLVTAGVSGQAKLIATSVALINQVALKNPASGFAPKFVLDNFEISIGLKKGEPQLKAKLDEWVETNMKNGKLNAIYKKFYGVDIPDLPKQ